jgi:hypothetical protein
MLSAQYEVSKVESKLLLQKPSQNELLEACRIPFFRQLR